MKMVLPISVVMDFALMRVIPGMVVACPSDDIEAKANGRSSL